MLETLKDAVIFRPSIVFGPEDGFFNRFAEMARLSPVLPLIGGGHTRFQPVFVGDVAEAIARSVDGTVKGGKIYELGGPQVLTFRQCMEEMLEVIGRKRLLVSLPWWVARMQGVDPRPAAESAAHRGPGHAARIRQRRLGRGREAGPHAGRHRHSAAVDRRDPAVLSLEYRPAGQFTRKTEADPGPV